MRYQYKTKGTCSQMIEFDLEGDRIFNITFHGGCNGNLKAIAKLVDGYRVEEIEEKLKGNTCGFRSTSCADQLAVSARKAYEESQA